MEKKRIVWLYPRLTSWMGGVRFVFEALSRLALTYDTVLIVQRTDPEVAEAFSAAGVKVVCTNTPSFTETSFWLRFHSVVRENTRVLRNYVNSPEDIVISAMFPMNCVAAGLDCRHVQIIYEPFAMFFDPRYQKSHSVPIHLFCLLVSKLFAETDIKAVQKPHRLLALSDYERQSILRVYGRQADICYEGVDIEHFRPKPSRLLEERYAGKKVVFHSTGYDSYKGTDLVINAVPLVAEKVKDVVFLISHTRVNAGKLKGYEQFLKSRNVEDKVEFIGFADYDLLPSYYTLAQVYVEPGYGRSMSLSSKEANGCGTPSIRGNVGTEDVIDGKTGFLVSTSDEKDLAGRIAQLLNDRPLRDRMGTEAYNFIHERFTWDSVVARIEKHFRPEWPEA